ncbi:uncharacterized protein LOC134302124 [Trichomycterus rosablanca]|uniref:uncharacterized protein LOC134302124 n=1 Tax=Trichomycterus rosablanca TaxID=2290929 RepID=UPI002F358083
MATINLKEHLDFLNKDQLSDREPSDPDILQTQEDVFSLNSSSLCLIEAAQANSKTKSTEVDKSGILAHLHHGSPLESITELAEVEDTSEHRSPGDGEIRMKETTEETFSTPTARRASLSTDGRCDSLNLTDFEQVHHMDCTARLESLMTDTCDHMPEIPVGSRPQDDTASLQVKSYTPDWTEAPQHHLTSSNSCSGVLEVRLDSQTSITPQQDLQEPTEEPLYPKISANRIATLNDGLSDSDDKPKSEMSDDRKCENKEANQNLIEILSTCEAKVDQLEQLKSSSFELSAQLHSSRALASRLHHRVLYLEHQSHLKDKELHELTMKLEKTSEALRARNSEMSSITDELHRLEVKNMPTSARTISVNGQVATNSHHLDHSSSRVCTLL